MLRIWPVGITVNESRYRRSRIDRGLLSLSGRHFEEGIDYQTRSGENYAITSLTLRFPKNMCECLLLTGRDHSLRRFMDIVAYRMTPETLRNLQQVLVPDFLNYDTSLNDG